MPPFETGGPSLSRGARGTTRARGARNPVQRGRSRGGHETRGGSQQASSTRGGNGISSRGHQHRDGNRGGHSGHSQPQSSGNGDHIPGTSRSNRQPFERKGPVFGFKRLQGFLSATTDEVILSIHLDLEAWHEFLESDELTAKSDTLLVLAVQILGDKVCCDTILGRQQMGILIKSCGTKFVAKINLKSQKICMGMDSMDSLSAATKRLKLVSDFMEVDVGPKVFLTSLHKYTAFMAKKMPDAALDFLLGAVAGAYGAMLILSATDNSYTQLATQFADLRQDMQLLGKKKEEKPKPFQTRRFQFTNEQEEELHGMEAPEDFRTIDIIPTPKELLSKDEVFLRPNKKSGAYNDADHYLDVQFRLLREDFVQPLKKGIQDFMKNRFDYMSKKKKIPLGTIRVYPEVQIISGELVRDVFIYKVQLTEDTYKRIRWEKSKRLLNGSLLVFTSDFFQTAYFATVATRYTEELAKGVVSVLWEGVKPLWDTDDEFLMVECEVYFEAYRHTLQTLKELPLKDFPMSKFIVASSSEVGPPKYLVDSEHTMKLRLHNQEDEVYVSPLMPEQWPSGEALGLDVNQFAAFQAAVTNEFAIIQGPPGTGKTFLGLKIAAMFLDNQELWEGNPICVVCYTNHALDQFLEGIVDKFAEMGDKTPDIVRVGARSKSEKLEPFSLTNAVRRRTHNMPRHFFPNRSEIISGIDELRNQRSSAMAAVMGLRDLQGIVYFRNLDVWKELSDEFPKPLFAKFQSPDWFGIYFNMFAINNFSAENILRSWFYIRQFSGGKNIKKVQRVESKNRPQEPANVSDDEDYDVNELLEHRIVEDIYAEGDRRAPVQMGKLLSYIPQFSIKDCEKNIQSFRDSIVKILEQGGKKNEMGQKIHQLEVQMGIAENLRSFIDELFSAYRHDLIELPDVTQFMEQITKDAVDADVAIKLEKLSGPERWAVFFTVVERARVLSARTASKIDERLAHEQKELQEMESYRKGHILKNSKVVGMTTTGAAKYHELVKMMKSKIVIVEEAAEVLESHIVTCLTENCEHLILIGDHRQLRPSTTVYDLAKKFSFDISLFERMINNDLHCYQLKEQHRMRPEIADLVVGTVYEELNNNPCVFLYPAVKGITKNLFFISHNELEKSESDSMSKSNEFEAKYLAGLCRYLILQGYSTDQITVLTTYTGQMFLLKKVIFNIPNCKGIQVTVVDNFQGQENDIILLSLVRSNLDSKIGFLNVENRVCVALSRARHGLFLIGNMKMLASKSGIWTQIQEKLNNRGECGSSLTLECQNHRTLSEVTTYDEFLQKAPEGGCQIPCDTQLKCTHHCVKICHVKDSNHEEYQCQLPCLNKCINDHPCPMACSRVCPLCYVKIMKKLPCDHEKLMPCHQNVAEVKCYIEVLRKLSCGHEHDMACHLDPMDFKCYVDVEKELPCTHRRTIKCHEDPGLVICRVTMMKTLQCGHEQESECRFLPEAIKCLTMVTITIENCGHQKEVNCKDINAPVVCKNKCTTRLPCGHACTKLCHFSEDPQHLSYICKKDCGKACPEGHICKPKHVCHKPCPPCVVKVERKLPCTHGVKKMDCHVDVTKYECLSHCEKTLGCGHKCQSLCFEPCKPCQEPTSKRIPECRHMINVGCSEVPLRSMCMELVKPLRQSECQHDTLVPCGISTTASHSEVMKYCVTTCKTEFSPSVVGCGHKCKGTCKSCLQGRFHEKCGENCGKPLVCGHVCDFPCSKTCPPCGKLCIMKCEHSECKNKCGTPCQDCTEKCPWQCPHQRCTKLCREMCDREPCDEPCDKLLKCGHPCIGYCGELCPTQCRICDKIELTEFVILGTEEDEDSRFIYLPDCKHAIEAEALTYHMNLHFDGGEIGIKRCPRCTTVIRSCRRFGNIIRNRLLDVILVKRKIFGDQKKTQATRITLIPKLQRDENNRWGRTFSVLQNELLEMLTQRIPVKRGSKDMRTVPKQVDEITMASINGIAAYAEGAIDTLLNPKNPLSAELYTDLLSKYRSLFRIVMGRKFPLTPIEFRDISQELDRLADLNQLYMRRSSRQFGHTHTLAAPVYDRAMVVVLSPKPYTDRCSKELRALLRELEDSLKTGLGITEKEKREILLAIGMQQGHWFKCPNGHIYAIGDCGGANQEGTCNECGERIGGTSHQLIRGNTLAAEMDGARGPAWPTALQYA